MNGTTKTKLLDIKIDSSFDGYPFTISDDQNFSFNFGTSPINDFFGMTHVDRNNKIRLQYSAHDNSQSFFKLRDKNGAEFFSVSEGGDYGAFIHLLKADSRIVIGSNASYLYNDGHKFVVKDGSAMIEGNILTNSNLGIGTNSFIDGTDTYRLSVEGKIRAHAVKVYTTWADFVFEDNYKLPTLEEVEEYIIDHGHLKDIPSAKDVENNGIELGEMNKLLLQKVEELTLYLIEIKKELNQLKSKS